MADLRGKAFGTWSSSVMLLLGSWDAASQGKDVLFYSLMRVFVLEL